MPTQSAILFQSTTQPPSPASPTAIALVVGDVSACRWRSARSVSWRARVMVVIARVRATRTARGARGASLSSCSAAACAWTAWRQSVTSLTRRRARRRRYVLCSAGGTLRRQAHQATAAAAAAATRRYGTRMRGDCLSSVGIAYHGIGPSTGAFGYHRRFRFRVESGEPLWAARRPV